MKVDYDKYEVYKSSQVPYLFGETYALAFPKKAVFSGRKSAAQDFICSQYAFYVQAEKMRGTPASETFDALMNIDKFIDRFLSERNDEYLKDEIPFGDDNYDILRNPIWRPFDWYLFCHLLACYVKSVRKYLSSWTVANENSMMVVEQRDLSQLLSLNDLELVLSLSDEFLQKKGWGSEEAKKISRSSPIPSEYEILRVSAWGVSKGIHLHRGLSRLFDAIRRQQFAITAAHIRAIQENSERLMSGKAAADEEQEILESRQFVREALESWPDASEFISREKGFEIAKLAGQARAFSKEFLQDDEVYKRVARAMISSELNFEILFRLKELDSVKPILVDDLDLYIPSSLTKYLGASYEPLLPADASAFNFDLESQVLPEATEQIVSFFKLFEERFPHEAWVSFFKFVDQIERAARGRQVDKFNQEIREGAYGERDDFEKVAFFGMNLSSYAQRKTDAVLGFMAFSSMVDDLDITPFSALQREKNLADDDITEKYFEGSESLRLLTENGFKKELKQLYNRIDWQKASLMQMEKFGDDLKSQGTELYRWLQSGTST